MVERVARWGRWPARLYGQLAYRLRYRPYLYYTLQYPNFIPPDVSSQFQAAATRWSYQEGYGFFRRSTVGSYLPFFLPPCFFQQSPASL